jgi:hypothetical protein
MPFSSHILITQPPVKTVGQGGSAHPRVFAIMHLVKHNLGSLNSWLERMVGVGPLI